MGSLCCLFATCNGRQCFPVRCVESFYTLTAAGRLLPTSSASTCAGNSGTTVHNHREEGCSCSPWPTPYLSNAECPSMMLSAVRETVASKLHSVCSQLPRALDALYVCMVVLSIIAQTMRSTIAGMRQVTCESQLSPDDELMP